MAILQIDQVRIGEFCKKWNVAEFAIFGSALRADFQPDSDVDVLVTFKPNSKRSLFDLVQMEEELEGMFGRKVDLVTRPGIEASRNYLRRKAILSSARVVYAA
jgi:predicted nucleotidyltransferase